MTAQTTVYFDFIDPGSYLLLLQLEETGIDPDTLRWVGVELALPPSEMVDPHGDGWSEYCDRVDEHASELNRVIPRPDFLPWTRKAHELALHGATRETPLIAPLFRAHFEEGLDLGRVDVLTGIAVSAGLDVTETKAVLDVDKYTQQVTEARTTALEAGIERIPTLVAGARSLVGPAPIHDLRTLFDSPGHDRPGN